MTQFIFNGDLKIGTFDNITGTGSNFASFKALNNATIAPGAIFNFSGSGVSAGAGGVGQLGGSAGSGAFGGQGGFASSSAAGVGQGPGSTYFPILPATLAPPAMPEAPVGTVRSATADSAVPMVAPGGPGSTATPPPHQAARLALAVSPPTAVRRAPEAEAVPTAGAGRAALEVTVGFAVSPGKMAIQAMWAALAAAAETRVRALG